MKKCALNCKIIVLYCHNQKNVVHNIQIIRSFHSLFLRGAGGVSAGEAGPFVSSGSFAAPPFRRIGVRSRCF